MERFNMITVDRVLNYFICAPCGREFTYETGLLQHCRSSRLHDGLWCEQCKHLSGDDWTQAAHMRDWHGQQDLNRQNNVHRQRDVYGQPPMAGPDPPGYELCQFCNRNFHSQAQLTMHLTHVHNYCSTCQTLCDDYNSHLLDFHGQCPECGEQFQNAYNLYMHSQLHPPRAKECRGCSKRFPSDAAIFAHLEAATCSSGIRFNEIDSWAFECPGSRSYTNQWGDYYMYRCPSCGDDFRYCSSMLKHVESHTCDANGNQLLEVLKNYIMAKFGEFEGFDYESE